MIKFILALALALTSVGCATGSDTTRSDLEELRRLRSENASMHRQLGTQGGYAPQAGMPMAGPSAMYPQVGQRDYLANVPQNVGSLYGPTERCAKGGRSIALHNGFEPNHLRCFIDGVEIHVLGSGGRMATLPPGQVVHLCVRPGHHVITAIALDPDGLMELGGRLSQGSIEFTTGAAPRDLYIEHADFLLSDN